MPATRRPSSPPLYRCKSARHHLSRSGGGQDTLSAYFTPAAKVGTKVKRGEPGTATVLAPGTAGTAGVCGFSGSRLGGTAFAAPARYTFVLSQQHGAWRIAHHPSSPRAKPE